MNIFIIQKKVLEQLTNRQGAPHERIPAVLRRFGVSDRNLIDEGSWRRTYDMGDMVLKVPYNREALTEQLVEYALYTENLEFLRRHSRFYGRNGFRYFYAYHKALGLPLPLNPCEIDLVEELPVLMAPKLIPVWKTGEDALNPWWDYLTDGYQAGVVKVGAPPLLFDYNAWFGATQWVFLKDLKRFHPDDHVKIWEQMQQCMEVMGR